MIPQDRTCRQLRNLQGEMRWVRWWGREAPKRSISLSSDDRAVGLWPERQHVPLPFGGAFSTGRPPVLLPVHVLRERSFLRLKCQQPLDRCGQADRTLKIRLFRDKFVDNIWRTWLVEIGFRSLCKQLVWILLLYMQRWNWLSRHALDHGCFWTQGRITVTSHMREYVANMEDPKDLFVILSLSRILCVEQAIPSKKCRTINS